MDLYSSISFLFCKKEKQNVIFLRHDYLCLRCRRMQWVYSKSLSVTCIKVTKMKTFSLPTITKKQTENHCYYSSTQQFFYLI